MTQKQYDLVVEFLLAERRSEILTDNKSSVISIGENPCGNLGGIFHFGISSVLIKLKDDENNYCDPCLCCRIHYDCQRITCPPPIAAVSVTATWYSNYPPPSNYHQYYYNNYYQQIWFYYYYYSPDHNNNNTVSRSGYKSIKWIIFEAVILLQFKININLELQKYYRPYLLVIVIVIVLVVVAWGRVVAVPRGSNTNGSNRRRAGDTLAIIMYAAAQARMAIIVFSIFFQFCSSEAIRK